MSVIKWEETGGLLVDTCAQLVFSVRVVRMIENMGMILNAPAEMLAQRTFWARRTKEQVSWVNHDGRFHPRAYDGLGQALRIGEVWVLLKGFKKR